MAVDIAGIVGPENMNVGAKEKVIAILKALDAPAVDRRYLYVRWARLVGVQAIPADINRVALWSQSH